MGVNVAAGIAKDIGGNTPSASYDHQYLAWVFQDDTIGSVNRYGWVEVSLSVANYPTGPNVTIWGYAYDDTGAKPTMGQLNVPEPTSGALLALGAMALGSRGLRKWRQVRQPVNPA
ncbi:MAG: PEP-CTERM sorting domain-containing protein [Verrucomicrobiota bacterium]